MTINSELSTIDRPRRTNINFKKADWARYAEDCDKYLVEAGEARTVEQAEKKSVIPKCYSSEKLIALNTLHEVVPTWYSFHS